MWFGANTSGLDNRDTLELIARHRVAGYGWQQGTGTLSPGENLGRGEVYGAEAATHLTDYLSLTGGANRTLVFVYRQIACALQLYAVPRAAASNSADAAFWISAPPASNSSDSGSPCLQSNPWGTQDPYWNFSVAAAAEYFAREVGGEAADEAGVLGAVFFDESDLSYCGFWSKPELGCPALSAEDAAAQHSAAMVVLANTTQILNAAGVIPLFSLDNRLRASGNLTSAAPPCALPEDDLLAALANSTWARFYENWPSSYFAPDTPDTRAAIIANAALEGAAGVPVLAHVYAGACPDPRPPIPPGPGRLGGDLEYGLAAFLMVQVCASAGAATGVAQAAQLVAAASEAGRGSEQQLEQPQADPQALRPRQAAQ